MKRVAYKQSKVKMLVLKLSFALGSAFILILFINSCNTQPKRIAQNTDELITRMTSELHQLKSVSSPQSSISYSFQEKAYSFTSQRPSNSAQIQCSKIEYYLEANILFRRKNSKPLAILDNVEEFNISFYNDCQQKLAMNIEHREKPYFVKLNLKFKGNHQKSISRTLYYN